MLIEAPSEVAVGDVVAGPVSPAVGPRALPELVPAPQQQHQAVSGLQRSASAAVVTTNQGSNVTYSHYVNGSIFSVPEFKSWSGALHGKDQSLEVSLYSFVKSYLR